MLPKTLDPDTLRTVALVAIVALAVLAFVVMRVVQKMVLRVVLLGALAGAGLYMWSQRAELSDCIPRCSCTFAGFDVQIDAPGCDIDKGEGAPAA